MSWIRRIDLIEPYTCSPLILEPYSPFSPCFIEEEDEDLCLPLGFASPSPLDLYETVTDLVQIRRKVKKPEYPLKYLCHRVSELETKFERLVKGQGSSECDRKYKLTKEIKGSGERKYTWEAEIGEPVSRKYTVEAEEGKYKWTAEIKGGTKEVALKKEKKKVVKDVGADVEKKKKKKSYDWTTEMKSERENGEVSHTYVIKAKARGEKKEKHEEKEKEKKCKSKKKEKARVVMIEEDEEEEEEEEEQEERRAIVLKKVLRHLCGLYWFMKLVE